MTDYEKGLEKLGLFKSITCDGLVYDHWQPRSLRNECATGAYFGL